VRKEGKGGQDQEIEKVTIPDKGNDDILISSNHEEHHLCRKRLTGPDILGSANPTQRDV
jgi:hypothetical protein